MKLLNYCLVKDSFNDKKTGKPVEYETYYLILKDNKGFQNVQKMKAKIILEKDIKALLGKEIETYYRLNPFNQKYELDHITEKIDKNQNLIDLS